MEGISGSLAATELGLLRGSVGLVESTRTWRLAYEAIQPQLRSACAGHVVDIQHVGSTSVPGLQAKPILDVAIGVRPEGAIPAELVDALVGLGFIDRGTGATSVGRLLVWEVEPGVRAVHLHIVGYGTQEWSNYVDFRDALRTDANLAGEYARAKEDLARRHRQDRAAYTSGKSLFVEQILERSNSPVLSPSHPSRETGRGGTPASQSAEGFRRKGSHRAH